MIQLHRLEGFYRVAIAQGYARAARQFPYPISQPAVHQQVRKLEADLGTRLFERVGKDRVVPTAAGRRLLSFCAPFFEELPSVVRSIEAMSFGGELRIDAAGLAIRHLLPTWIKRITSSRQDIDVRLQEIDAPDFERLRSGAADMIVDYFPAVPSWVTVAAVARCHVFVVAPRDHAACGKSVSWRALAEETFIAYDPALPHHALQQTALRELGIKPPRTLLAGSVDTIVSFVQAGLGFSLVPWLDERGPRARGVKAYSSKKHPRFDMHVATRKTDVPSPLLEHALALAPDVRG